MAPSAEVNDKLVTNGNHVLAGRAGAAKGGVVEGPPDALSPESQMTANRTAESHSGVRS